MTLLKEVLDPALTIYRESNEEFYLGYRNARNTRRCRPVLWKSWRW
jgi:hypothetical protein